MMLRACKNWPKDSLVTLQVSDTQQDGWTAVDISYWELDNAIAGGFEASVIEEYYCELERRLKNYEE